MVVNQTTFGRYNLNSRLLTSCIDYRLLGNNRNLIGLRVECTTIAVIESNASGPIRGDQDLLPIDFQVLPYQTPGQIIHGGTLVDFGQRDELRQIAEHQVSLFDQVLHFFGKVLQNVAGIEVGDEQVRRSLAVLFVDVFAYGKLFRHEITLNVEYANFLVTIDMSRRIAASDLALTPT